MGVDAVWIPPTPKNKNATNDVGYSPFDQYDLGDKYQKGAARTRFGSKDELLRLVAVLHANGIEVVQDVVLNHADGAGTADGSGG
jgi:alpha-amylase